MPIAAQLIDTRLRAGCRRAMDQHSARAKPLDNQRRLGGFSATNQDATRTQGAKGHHIDMVAATARCQRAYFTRRMSSSICGVKRCSSAQVFWNSAGAGQIPA